MNYEKIWNELKQILKETLKEERNIYGYSNTNREYAEKLFNMMKKIEANQSLIEAGY